MPNWCNNNLHVTGPEKDIKLFKAAACAPEQTYNDYRSHEGRWKIHDDIRLKAISQYLPEPGPTVVFSFHGLYPVPEDYRRFPYDCNRAREIGELVGEPRTQGGYSWEIENWGCKWGAAESYLNHVEPTYLSYAFDTAWAPPLEFLETVSSKWPTLSFEIDYAEPGMGFEGTAVYEGGVEVSHEQREYEYEEDDE